MSPDEQYLEELAENYQREQHIAKTSLAKDKSPKSIQKTVREFHKRLDRQMAGNMEKHNISLACKKGCAHCCTTRVGVFGYEVIAMAKHIRDTFSGSELSGIVQKLEVAAKAKAREMETGMVHSVTPCAFLVNNACSIYDIRPTMCRQHNSLSLDDCLKNKPSTNKGLKETTTATIHGFTDGACHSGLKKTAYELNQALLIAINDPSAAKKWVSGINTFPILPPDA